LLAKRISLEDVKLIVFDEAHRATGGYAYVFIASEYAKQNPKGRSLALTASPGHELERINAICNNLGVEIVEQRDRDHREVKEFIKPLLIDYEFITLPKPMLSIKKHLEFAIRDRLVKLKRLKLTQSSELSSYYKKRLLELQSSLRRNIHNGDFTTMQGLSIVAEIIKIQHALGLLESESLAALEAYFKGIWEQSKTSSVKAVKNIVMDFHFRVAYQLTQESLANGIEHPKLDYLKDVFEETISKNPKAKILVFTEFRSNIDKILEKLSKFKVERFVGQASTVGKGMNQKEQIEMLELFKGGSVNALIATSVAEEGLDIPKVDLVVFYAPVPSAVRSIQRKGRTGRHDIGKILLLITKGTKDERYYWISKRREKQMKTVLSKLSNTDLKTEKRIDDFVKPKQEEVIIYTDTRESAVLKDLSNLGAKIELKKLDVGDFILSDAVVVERKEVADFASSLIDQRLFQQAIEMRRNFDKPLIIVEGNLHRMFTSRNINPNALRAAMASLALDYGIPLLFSSSSKETAEYLYLIAKREQLGLKREISLRGAKRNWSLSEQQQFLIEGLPLVGPNLAKNLLKEFKSPKGIANASTDDLQGLEKLGPKKAEQIKMIFEEEYEDG